MSQTLGASKGKGVLLLIHLFSLLTPLSLAAPQCPPAGRVVHVVFVRQLQCHLQGVAKVPAGSTSGESRLFSGASLAARLVLEGL